MHSMDSIDAMFLTFCFYVVLEIESQPLGMLPLNFSPQPLFIYFYFWDKSPLN